MMIHRLVKTLNSLISYNNKRKEGKTSKKQITSQVEDKSTTIVITRNIGGIKTGKISTLSTSRVFIESPKR